MFIPCSGWALLELLMDRRAKKAALPKICYTYPVMTKLGTVIPYVKKTQKIYKWRDTLFKLC